MPEAMLQWLLLLSAGCTGSLIQTNVRQQARPSLYEPAMWIQAHYSWIWGLKFAASLDPDPSTEPLHMQFHYNAIIR